MYSEWAKDEIRIEELEVFAHHGVYPEETRDGQTFYVNAVLHLDAQTAGMRDDLEKTVNYGSVCTFIHNWMQDNTCLLLEAAAERLADAILLEFRPAAGVELEIRKPHAPIRLTFGSVSVKVQRQWHKVYIAVGSNMGDREKYISDGIQALKEHSLIEVTKVSKLVDTEPYGGVEQENFLNGVLEMETLLGPWQLLEVLHEIENRAGRERTVHWGPRTLDLDILLYDQLCIQSEDLVIPHPDMERRSFVLEPLGKMAPCLLHPVSKKSMREMVLHLRVLNHEIHGPALVDY